MRHRMLPLVACMTMVWFSARVAAPVAAQSGAHATACRTHALRFGDTLFGVAVTYGISPLQIALENDLSSIYAPLPMQLTVCSAGAGPAAQTSYELEVSGARQVNLRSSPGWIGKGAWDERAHPWLGEHVTTTGSPVQRDNLWWWPVTYWGVHGWIAESSSQGSRLLVPTGIGTGMTGDSVDVTPVDQTVVVQPGDTLAAIAARTRSTVTAVVRRNLLSTTLIHPGDRLIVPSNALRPMDGWIAGQVTWTQDARPYGRTGWLVSLVQIADGTVRSIAVPEGCTVDYSVGGTASGAGLVQGVEIEAIGSTDPTWGIIVAREVHILPPNPVHNWWWGMP